MGGLMDDLKAMKKAIRAQYNYNPKTGVMTNAVHSRRYRVVFGALSGVLVNGRRIVYFKGKRYPIGILIFLYVDGVFPKFVGYKDTDTTNMRYSNLFVSEQRVNVHKNKRKNEFNIKRKLINTEIKNPTKLSDALFFCNQSFFNKTGQTCITQ